MFVKKTLVVLAVTIIVAMSFVTSSYAGVLIYGRGHGHGVGVSMAGVYGMARTGYNYRRILNHYYTNTAWSTRKDDRVIKAYCSKHKVWVTLKVRDYLYRLAEEPNTWPREGLRSTMVAARTYLWYKLERYGKMTGGQYWVHTINPATRPNIVRAVQNTTNQVLTYNGRAIIAAYSSSAGGYTAKMSEVWGGSDRPYLINRNSRWDSVFSSTYKWKKTVSSTTIQKAYPSIGSFRRLAIDARTSANRARSRVKTVRIIGSKRQVTDKGWNFKSKAGLKSNYFFLRPWPSLGQRPPDSRPRPRTYAKRFRSRRKGRRKVARVKLTWYVKDSTGKAYVKLKLKKRVYSRIRARRRTRYYNIYRLYKRKYSSTRNRVLRRRFLRAARWYFKRYRRSKPYVYKTVKMINYKWTKVNKWRTYLFLTKSPGKYRFYVYAKSQAGAYQRNVAGARGTVR